MRIAIVLLVVACGKTDKKPEAKTGAVDKLNITVGGEKLVADRAFIKRDTQDVWTVLVGAGKGSCESLIAGSNDGTGKAFSFTVQKRVSHVGHERFELTDLWSRDFETAGPATVDIKLEGNADKDTSTKIELPGIASKQLTVQGSLTAIGCGETPPTGAGVPKVPHASKGVIQIAGRQMRVGGVTVQARQGVAATSLPNITISQGPRDCSGVELPAPVILQRYDGKWFLAGTWIGKKIEGTPDDTKDLTFSANDVGKSEDGPTLELQLSGKGKFGDYTVEISGTAQAIECVQ